MHQVSATTRAAVPAAIDKNRNIIQFRQVSIGSMEHWSVYAAELMAVYYAISLVYQMAWKNQETSTANQEPVPILSDSMSALQAIANPWNKSGQRIIGVILQSAKELKARGVPLHLQWIPLRRPWKQHSRSPSQESSWPRQGAPLSTPPVTGERIHPSEGPERMGARME